MTALLRNARAVRAVLVSMALLGVTAAVDASQLATRQTLPNGMVVLHTERPSVPMVSVVMAVQAGSAAEPEAKAGLAYLTAALLTEGAGSRTSREISDAIEFVGGSLSASGGADYTTISLTVLKKDAELGFDLLADVVMHPAFRQEELERKKRIITNGLIQQNEEPGTVASLAFSKAVFGSHPYGRQVQGTVESVAAISRKDLSDFHDAWFAPNNAIISVVGDISRDELMQLLTRFFGTWQQKPVPSVHLAEPAPRTAREVIRVSKDLTQTNIVLGHLGISRDNPDYYAVLVMNYILGGGGFASRLMDNIRDNRGLAYDVHSYFSASRYGGSFQAVLQTKNESAATAIAEVIGEMERMQQEPVSDRELADAKSYLTGSFPLRIDSNTKIAGFNLAVEYYGLGVDYVDRYPEIINTITREDIQRVARKYLDPAHYVLVVVGDLGKAGLDK